MASNARQSEGLVSADGVLDGPEGSARRGATLIMHGNRTNIQTGAPR
jgi:hypothetical protein